MRTPKVASIALLTVTWAGALSIPHSLAVVVFDYAGVQPGVLASAATTGRRAFRTAGVETQWILCSSRQSCYLPDRFVKVRILERPAAGAPVSSDSLGSTTICPDIDDCNVSFIFYDRVQDFADDASSPLDLALGYVMVHEIGHLMGLGHTPGGIMTAAFSAHDLHAAATGWLGFAAEDARKLRAAVARSQKASAPEKPTWVSAWRTALVP